MTLAGLLATAIALWGMFSGPVYPGPISIQQHSMTQPGRLAETYPGHPTDNVQWVLIQGQGWRLVNRWSTCIIDVAPGWPQLPSDIKQNLITHEVGHCMNQAHTDPALCKPPLACNVMNPSIAQRTFITIGQRISARMSFGEYP